MSLKYGILAYPAGHSLSPAMHNAAFKAAGVKAKYETFEVKPEDLGSFMDDLVAGKGQGAGVSGLSVSAPHKEKILSYLDEVSGSARSIGAVNTVTVREEDGARKLYGDNTDFVGAVDALKEKVSGTMGLKSKRVVVLGAGGAARAIVYGLLKEGAKVTVLNRTFDKAHQLANSFAQRFGDENVKFGVLEGAANFAPDILVQTTSIWITDGLEARILPEKYFSDLAKDEVRPLVMDIVYTPRMTPLLFAAEDADCDIVTGDKMLLNQAISQFEIFTGKKATKEVKEAMGAAMREGM
jgi:shikimate dehydrogenase